MQTFLIADANRRGTIINRRKRELSRIHEQYDAIDARFMRRVEALELDKSDGPGTSPGTTSARTDDKGQVMKGKGPKHKRDTVIVFNEEDETASIWMASETVYRRLRKAGYIPAQDNERSASFELPRGDIKLPRPRRKRTLSGQQRREARDRMENVRNSVSCSRDQLN